MGYLCHHKPREPCKIGDQRAVMMGSWGDGGRAASQTMQGLSDKETRWFWMWVGLGLVASRTADNHICAV